MRQIDSIHIELYGNWLDQLSL